MNHTNKKYSIGALQLFEGQSHLSRHNGRERWESTCWLAELFLKSVEENNPWIYNSPSRPILLRVDMIIDARDYMYVT